MADAIYATRVVLCELFASAHHHHHRVPDMTFDTACSSHGALNTAVSVRAPPPISDWNEASSRSCQRTQSTTMLQRCVSSGDAMKWCGRRETSWKVE
jgi:hypothetical protein